MGELKNQVVLITGCSTGIGRALAQEMAQRGHRTFASARDPESLQGLDSCERVPLDITKTQSIDFAVSRVLETAGRIDMLVNNAGINRFGPLVELPREETHQVFETNVLGQLAMIQAVFPAMAQQASGRIVNFGSVIGVFATPWCASYCGSKSAMHTLSDMLRIEVAPFGIDVIQVRPGSVKSSIAENSSRDLDQFRGPPSRYGFAYDDIVARSHLSQDDPLDTSACARIVTSAITRRRARRIVRVGPGARWLPWLKKLPAPLLDRLLARRFGLTHRQN